LRPGKPGCGVCKIILTGFWCCGREIVKEVYRPSRVPPRWRLDGDVCQLYFEEMTEPVWPETKATAAL
jgi:hypothetical protein